MGNRFRVSKTLVNKVEEMGIPTDVLLDRCGLPSGALHQEKIFVTTDEFFALYRTIAELGGAPDFGLKLGTEERMERYDPIAIAALYTRSFRDALERIARYKQLTCPEKIALEERDDECVVRFEWLLADETEPELLVDTCFAWMLTIARRGTAQPLNPKRIEFQRPAVNREIYEAHFRCPVKFDSAHNALIFHKADIDRPFVTHNADLLAMISPQLEAELKQQLAEKSISEQVKGILKRLLAGKRPELQDVARELRLSTRTLQRRLTEEKASFQQIVEKARREMARHYLLHSSLELNETAYLLGYEDPNSFFRAFHNWEGTSPGVWRASQRRRGEEQFEPSAVLQSVGVGEEEEAPRMKLASSVS
jgi:AraC-like DNA-binding protein